MTTQAKREVRIIRNTLTAGWYVQYVKRRKGQHYCAAYFDYNKPDGSERKLSDVQEWVNSQPKLKLV